MSFLHVQQPDFNLVAAITTACYSNRSKISSPSPKRDQSLFCLRTFSLHCTTGTTSLQNFTSTPTRKPTNISFANKFTKGIIYTGLIICITCREIQNSHELNSKQCAEQNVNYAWAVWISSDSRLYPILSIKLL